MRLIQLGHSMNELVMPDVYVEIIRERPRSVGMTFFCDFVICGGWSKFKNLNCVSALWILLKFSVVVASVASC